MKKTVYYYAGLILGLVGIVCLILTIVMSPKTILGYLLGGISIIGSALLMLFSFCMGQDEKERSIDSITGKTAIEEIALALNENRLSSKLNVVDYAFKGNLCVYMEIENDELFHVTLFKNYLEIECYSKEIEKQLSDFEKKRDNESNLELKKNYEEEIYHILETSDVKWAKEKIKGKSMNEIVTIIENKILY